MQILSKFKQQVLSFNWWTNHFKRCSSSLIILLVMAESSLESVNSTVLELRQEVNEMYRNLLLDEDSQVDAIKTRIKKSWPKVVGVPCDVSKSEDVQALSEAAAREFGNIDIWVRTWCEAILTLISRVYTNRTLSKFCVKVVELRLLIFG
jgi:enoyl-[acyl-carrier-protein] reductase (NADH)